MQPTVHPFKPRFSKERKYMESLEERLDMGRQGKVRQEMARIDMEKQGKARHGVGIGIVIGIERKGKYRNRKEKHGMIIQGKERKGKARHGKARQDKARQGKAKKGNEINGKDRKGMTRKGKAW
jgi:hypothetical protein